MPLNLPQGVRNALQLEACSESDAAKPHDIGATIVRRRLTARETVTILDASRRLHSGSACGLFDGERGGGARPIAPPYANSRS